MEEKTTCGASDERINGNGQSPGLLKSGKPSIASFASQLLPTSLLRIVTDYLSNDKNEKTVGYALLGEEPITLCLSQDIYLSVASHWYMGFLPPESDWHDRIPVKVDKKLSVNDHENCLHLLASDCSNYYGIVINVLVVNLSLATSGSPNALDALRRTVEALGERLNSVKYVVISVTEYASYCFSLQVPIDKATGLRQLVDDRQPLNLVFEDLYTFWAKNQSLTVHDLLAFYFSSNAKPASERYLTKFVITLNHPYHKDRFNRETPNVPSDKIMYVDCVTSMMDCEKNDKDPTRLCHAIHFNPFDVSLGDIKNFCDRLGKASWYRDNRHLEKIVIDARDFYHAWLLPQPSAPLTNTTPLSALTELTLKGSGSVLHLMHLNNGYFKNLTFFSFIGGVIGGHLDSRNVPRLRTLILELSSRCLQPQSKLNPLMREHCQSILHAERPWQLVTAKDPGGWSLAAYDIPTPNPQDEEKDESPHSRHRSQPLIRHLVLGLRMHENSIEFQRKVEGRSSLEEAADDNGVLVWSPERVEKISAFGLTGKRKIPFELSDWTSGETSILSSLECDNLNLMISGGALPRLQSLEVTESDVQLSSTFEQVKTMSFEDISFKSGWEVYAPLLQSFNCRRMVHGKSISLFPHRLPYLSSLQIDPTKNDPTSCPQIFMHEDNAMLSSPIKHLVLGQGMVFSPLFTQLQLHRVLHLELTVSFNQLPADWSDTAWQCESLKIRFFKTPREKLSSPEFPFLTSLPPLPCVTKLTVLVDSSDVLLNSEMPNLTKLTLNSSFMFGPNLKCPLLKQVNFSGPMPSGDDERILNPDTYRAIGAQPRFIYLQNGDVLHTMDWNNIPNES